MTLLHVVANNGELSQARISIIQPEIEMPGMWKGHTVRGEQPLRAFMAFFDAADPLLRVSAPLYVF